MQVILIMRVDIIVVAIWLRLDVCDDDVVAVLGENEMKRGREQKVVLSDNFLRLCKCRCVLATIHATSATLPLLTKDGGIPPSFNLSDELLRTTKPCILPLLDRRGRWACGEIGGGDKKNLWTSKVSFSEVQEVREVFHGILLISSIRNVMR